MGNESGVQLQGYPGESYWHPYQNAWTNRASEDRKNGEELARRFVANNAPKERTALLRKTPANLTDGSAWLHDKNLMNGSTWAHDMGQELARRFMREHMPAIATSDDYAA